MDAFVGHFQQVRRPLRTKSGKRPIKVGKLTLPALQKNSFGFAWGFGIEKWQGFLVNFLWSRFPGNKKSSKNRGKFGAFRERVEYCFESTVSEKRTQ